MNRFTQSGGTAYSSKNMNWETPLSLFNELNKKYQFTLDPASSDSNAKCVKHYTIADNGLKQDWSGESVFLNPPYGNEISAWVKKASQEALKPNTIIVLLLPARTDTRWFHEYLYHRAKIDFLKGRLHFTINRVTQQSAPFPSMIAVLGGKDQ